MAVVQINIMKTKPLTFLLALTFVILILASCAESPSSKNTSINNNPYLSSFFKNILGPSESSTFEESITTEFERNLGFYSLITKEKEPSIYPLLTFGYPKLIGDPKPKGFEEEDEGGEYSSLSVSSKLLGYFLKDPIKTFDTIFNLNFYENNDLSKIYLQV